jgi:hypothetical protein
VWVELKPADLWLLLSLHIAIRWWQCVWWYGVHSPSMDPSLPEYYSVLCTGVE